ncbi:MAG: molybdopterin molybdotransferase MoeA [Thiotrichales bacterium]|nr:molybdopterin molybdotransferase MoeA [Thiotrichales bacterium]
MSDSSIKKEISCMDDFDPESLIPDQAREKIITSLEPLTGSVPVPVRQCLNRILAEDIVSGINVPSGTNSAMDGYALAGSELPEQGSRDFRLVGTSLAGQPFSGTVNPGECVRIMTGAILPERTDTVVIQEHVQINDKTVRIGTDTRPGSNVRNAGEDISAGDTVLKRGDFLTPADLGLIASLGIADISVTRKLKVAFFSTGDELRSIGETLEDGAIYDSNRYTLHGMLERLNVEIIDLGVIRDTEQEIEDALLKASACADVIITSGGVSVGDADYIKGVLQKIGNVAFWKVAMKPGRPLTFGRIQDACFFGLPGNPVSVMVTFYQFVQPALRFMMGATDITPLTVTVPCMSKLKKRPGRVEYQRGILTRDDRGRMVVYKTGAQGSGILTSMSRANCFIVLPLESEGIQPENPVEVQPFHGIV